MFELTTEFAQKFIQQTVKNLPYNVNIMNHEGIIIASKDSSRIGNFHEVAHGLLAGSLKSGVVTTEKKYIGTKPGINMFIDYKDQHVGVICVTGDPDSVKSFAGFVKSSIETMLVYELQMNKNQKRLDKAARFLHYLLFDENYSSSEAENRASELNISNKNTSCIILLKTKTDVNNNIVFNSLSSGGETSPGIIAIKGRNDEFIILKIFRSNTEECIRNFKERIREYIQEFEKKLPEQIFTENFIYLVGTLQNSIDHYQLSYQHAQYLSLHQKDRKKIVFFNEQIRGFIQSSVTLKLYSDVFSAFQTIFKGDEKQVMVETIKVLAENNYHIVRSSNELNVHRNTVIFRLNKLKEALNIDPINNGFDREFLNELAHYLEKF